MNRHTIQSIAIACGLALTLSTLAATSFARGSGRSSRGTGHFGRSSFNRGNFGHSFNSNRFHNFSQRYYGWGYYGSSGYSYGWGWGSSNSPYSYGNSYYGNTSYGNSNSYGSNSYGNDSYGNTETGTGPTGSPSTPIPSNQNAVPSIAAGPNGQPTPVADNAPTAAAAPIPAVKLAEVKPAGTTTAATTTAATTTAATVATTKLSDKKEADDDSDDDDKAGSAGAPAVKSTPTAEKKVGTVANDPATKTAPATPSTPSNPLTGTFKASPAKDVQIELSLKDDKTFAWKFTANGQSQSFSGKYQIGPNSLLLTRNDGEPMDGTLERTGDNSFKFRMKGAESDDPGLSFSR
jgi:hypothetical protein